MLTVDQLIQHLKDKGVTFAIYSEDEARSHLDRHNNYFKLTSYRKNYMKYTAGPNAGKYERLEFAYLRELARLDTEIRHILLDMALDIEHFLKVALIKAVEDRMSECGDEDGYRVVSSFLLDEGTSSIIKRTEAVARRSGGYSRKVNQNRNNPYCCGLINSYASAMPIWAFVELITFGDLKELIEYYSKNTGWPIPIDLNSLDRVRQIRNACAHGNCIINDLRSNQHQIGTSDAPKYLTDFVKNAGISKTMRQKKLANPRINQIVHLLYVYDELVTSQNTRSIRILALRELVGVRMKQNKEYFIGNPIITTTYEFFEKLVAAIDF